jgi:hypothetical protein
MYTIDKMPDASYNWQQASRRLHPTHQPRFTGSNRRVPQVSAGGRHTCGIKTGPGFTDGKDYTGRLFCFGRNEEKQCSVPADVADAVWSTVSAGALPPDSQPQTCSDNARGCRLEDDMRHNHGFTQELNRFSVVCVTPLAGGAVACALLRRRLQRHRVQGAAAAALVDGTLQPNPTQPNRRHRHRHHRRPCSNK